MQMLAVSGASVINPYRFTESEVAEAAELAERCLAGIDDLAFSRTVTEHSRDERLKRRLRWCLDFPAEDSESAAAPLAGPVLLEWFGKKFTVVPKSTFI